MVTKLPMTGHSREASIASGSTTTRLLGTFQGVEYVLIVGVGGGVPHYTDYSRSTRNKNVEESKRGHRFWSWAVHKMQFSNLTRIFILDM